MRRRSVLIVDDNPLNLKLLAVVLGGQAFDVRTACDATEALRCLQQRPADVILLDLQLPDMDGLQLAQRLKADPVHRETRILAVTAYAMKGDRERSLAAGCDDYMSKPIDTRRLPRLVKRLLDGGPRADAED